jgi:hypothetical protein
MDEDHITRIKPKQSHAPSEVEIYTVLELHRQDIKSLKKQPHLHSHFHPQSTILQKRQQSHGDRTETDTQHNVHTVLEFPCQNQREPPHKQKDGIIDLAVPVVGLDVVGEGLRLDVGRVVVTVIVVV